MLIYWERFFSVSRTLIFWAYSHEVSPWILWKCRFGCEFDSSLLLRSLPFLLPSPLTSCCLTMYDIQPIVSSVPVEILGISAFVSALSFKFTLLNNLYRKCMQLFYIKLMEDYFFCIISFVFLITEKIIVNLLTQLPCTLPDIF